MLRTDKQTDKQILKQSQLTRHKLTTVVAYEFQMIRANTIRTNVLIICRIERMISCVARIILRQSDYC